MEQTAPLLSDRLYNVLKWIVMVLIPALSSAYFALGGLLGLPAVTEVIGVLAILGTFLTTILGLSKASYERSGAAYDGFVELETDPGGVKMASLNIDGDPETLLMTKDVITFKVKH